MSKVINSPQKKNFSTLDIKDIKEILNEEFDIPEENKIYFENEFNSVILRSPTFSNSNISQTNTTAISTPKKKSFTKQPFTTIKKIGKEKSYKQSKYYKQEIKKNKHVKFKKNFVEIFEIECWKKYNENNVYGKKKKVYCKCNIF